MTQWIGPLAMPDPQEEPAFTGCRTCGKEDCSDGNVFGVMLASPSKSIAPTPDQAVKILTRQADYTFSPKWDGVRCVAGINEHGVLLTNRNGVNITDRYPDVALALQETFQGTSVSLDGEIIALGKDGRPDFTLLSQRDRQTSVEGALKRARTVPVIYVAFDVLSLHDESLCQAHLIDRLPILRSLKDAYDWDPQHLWLSPDSTDGEAMWKVVTEHNLEGLIAKHCGSTYHAGRSTSWIKLKIVHRVSCVVTSWNEGTGSRAGRIGALNLSVYDGDDLVEIGRAGTGLTDADLAELHDLPMPFVVEVEYANYTADGRLRFPSFKGLRSDVTPEQCTITQLKEQR